MGGSVSIRAKAQAKAAAAAAAGNEVSASATGDVTSGTALPVGAVANAGGDSAGDRHSSKSDSAMVKGKSEGELEDVESSSSEDGSSNGEADLKCENSAENTGGLGKDDPRPEEISSKGDQEATKKISAVPCLRDVACQSECVADNPDPPMTADLDAPPPSPQRDHVTTDRNPQLSDSPALPSAGSEEVSCSANEHKAAAVPEVQQQQHQYLSSVEHHQRASSAPAGDEVQQHHHVCAGALKDPPSSDDHKAAAVPGSLAAVGDSLPGGMEAYTQQKCFPMCDVAVCEGPRPKVVSVSHGEEAGCSNGLPPVE